MAYADYLFYRSEFCGDELPAEAAPKWLTRASDELDTLTFGRLEAAFPTDGVHAAKVRKAVCAVAEALFRIDNQRQATSVQKAEDGSYRGPVASISSGRESISFVINDTAASVYAAAAADPGAQTRLLWAVAAKYLANIPDANGVNLLYAGGAGGVL